MYKRDRKESNASEERDRKNFILRHHSLKKNWVYSGAPSINTTQYFPLKKMNKFRK